MFGYVSKAEAKAEGMTHYGSFYGVPLYMAMDGDEMQIMGRISWLEWLVDVFATIEQLVFPIVHGADAEPCFQFRVDGEL